MKQIQKIIQRVLEATHIPKVFLPYFFLVLSLFVTCTVAFYVLNTSYSKDSIHFQNSTNTISNMILDRIDIYVALLRGVKSYFVADENITEEEFTTYVETLELQERYPGVQGMGYIEIIERGEEWQFPYSIWPASDRNIYAPLTFFYPITDSNRKYLGYDVLTEPARVEALERARDEGTRRATRKLTLLQPPVEAGFVIYAPLYFTSDTPATIEERRGQLRGYIYTPFRVNNLMKGIFNENEDMGIDFTIYDGDTIDSENIMYTTVQEERYTPVFTSTKKIDVAGRTWTIHFSAKPSFQEDAEKNYVPLILLFGTIISLIGFYLSRSQYWATLMAEEAAFALAKTEQSLLEANKRTTDILESITDSFIAVDGEWNLTYVNKEATALLGHPHDELIGRNVWEVIPSLNETDFFEMLKNDKRQVNIQIEGYYHKKDKWYTVKVYPSEQGFSIYFHDITEQKKLEQMKDEFIAIASHELKTPVTSLKLFTQVMSRKVMKSGIAGLQNMFRKMDNQLDNLTHLINDLLDVNKIQSGKLSFNKIHFAIQDVVKTTVEDMQITSDTHKIQITGSSKKTVFGDPERIRQVITNLLSNAIKYSPTSNKVLVSVKDTKKEVEISITDFGIGIEESYQNKIFNRFFRVTGSDETQFQGMGIGLYISSEIIKRHDGRINVTSTKGKGSTFTFALPQSK